MSNLSGYQEGTITSDPNGSERSFRKAFYDGSSSGFPGDETIADLVKDVEENFMSGGHVYDYSSSDKRGSTGYDSVSDGALDYLFDNHFHSAPQNNDPIFPGTTAEELAEKLINGPSNMSTPSLCDALTLENGSPHKKVLSPMLLPTFKPASGCTDASEFIMRCFLTRLRVGITVMKYSRSRWCRSPHKRTLHISSDGRFIKWKPIENDLVGAVRVHSLDLSQCIEVRHALTQDQQNPSYLATTALRKKCKPCDAHKSLSLIFHNRTIDMTAVNSDQCKILLQGFSALCYHLRLSLDNKKAVQKCFHDNEKSATMACSSMGFINTSAKAA